MKISRGQNGQRTACARVARGGFTLVDVLVSLAVIGVLISILLPSVARVRESAQRVVCGSNLRQVGLGLNMYADDSRGLLPDSVFLPNRHSRSGEEGSPELMDIVRTAPGAYSQRPWGDWDGLGLLFEGEYLAASKVFYCPSHAGNHAFGQYERAWREEQGEIVSNYQFRGAGPDGLRRLASIQSSAAIVSDMLRSYEDLNHQRGFNVLQAGLAVSWVEDAGDQITTILLRNSGGGSAQVADLWDRLDGPDIRDDRPGFED